jgi:hypothetical protein
MRILTTDHVPERLRDGIRSRAGDVGSATREAARSAGDRVRTTAADQLVKAGKVVEPDRSSGRSRLLYLLVVPVLVAGAVWVARAVRTRTAAGETAGEAEGGAEAEKTERADGSKAPATSTNGRARPERAAAGRGASKAG